MQRDAEKDQKRLREEEKGKEWQGEVDKDRESMGRTDSLPRERILSARSSGSSFN